MRETGTHGSPKTSGEAEAVLRMLLGATLCFLEIRDRAIGSCAMDGPATSLAAAVDRDFLGFELERAAEDLRRSADAARLVAGPNPAAI